MKKRLFFLLTISLLLGYLNSEGQSVPSKTIQKDDISAGNKKRTRPELLNPSTTSEGDIKNAEVVKPTNRFQKKVRGSKNVNQLNPQPLPPKDKEINQLNPQPLPPKAKKINQLNPQPLPPKAKKINYKKIN